MIKKETFQKRREKLINKMVPSSIALLFSSFQTIRTNNVEYPFRQNSDFLYLTGFSEPKSLLILVKKDERHNYSILFNQPHDFIYEMWSGYCLGQDGAINILGVDYAFSWHDISNHLYLLLNGVNVIYYTQGVYNEADILVSNAMDKLKKNFSKGFRMPEKIDDWRPLVHEMRLFKSQEEIDILRIAGNISSLAHMRAMKKCRPNMFEYQLEGEIIHEFYSHGARFPAYNVIVGSGKNSCILHYNLNKSKLCNGDLVLIDAGCEYCGYASDITRTFPVNGKFSKSQYNIYKIVLLSLQKSLELLRPNISIVQIETSIAYIMVTELVKLGILSGNIDMLIAKKAHKKFFTHNLSHWIGLDVHDVSDKKTSNRYRILKPGMVLTIEPGLYFRSDHSVPIEYHGIGIRIEDTVVITETGNENITNNAVKNINEIQYLMTSNYNT